MQEIWKDIPEYEGYYQVSNLGRVKSLQRFGVRADRIKKPVIAGKGYLRTKLSINGKYKNILIHQLVAMAFLGHKPNGWKIVIDHIDFDKTNNNVNNLRIVSHYENNNKKHLPSSSKYTGVNWSKNNKRWIARIGVNNKRLNLGSFKDEYKAHLAYQSALSYYDKIKVID